MIVPRWVILALLLAPEAIAHADEPLAPHDLWTAWRFDPGVIIPLALAAWLFLRGARKVSPSRRLCFWSGWSVLVIALVSPLHPLGESLFSAHMAQHELLMIAAAPLLAISRPLVPMLWGVPLPWRRTLGKWINRAGPQTVWRFLTAPLSAWWIHAAAVWLWHVPRFFQATLESDIVHSAQHLSFFASAVLFWWSLFAQNAEKYGSAVLYVFTTAVHTSVLGALLTFSTSSWYPAYLATAPEWGLSAVEDQQIGGLIMWVPAGVIYIAIGLWLLAGWLRESDLSAKRREFAR